MYQQFPKKLPPLNPINLDNQQEKKVAFEDAPDPQDQVDLEPPPNHDSGLTHTNFLNDDIIHSCFPLSNRIGSRFSRLIHWDPARMTFVDVQNRIENKIYNPFDLSAFDQELIKDKTCILKVLSTSQLQMDTNIAHPFVRIHIVNMKNGCYIQKAKKDIKDLSQQYNAVYNYETNCITNIVDGERERKSCELELVTAFATNCTDMRTATNSRAVWNEEVLINVPSEIFFNQDSVILFELLDFHPQFLQQKIQDKLDIDNFYRIAWGYLRPMGLSKLHLGITKIQLYQYLFDTTKLKSANRRESIPLVYFDYIWNDKLEYDAILSVYLETQPQPEFVDVFERSLNVYQIEKGDKDIKEKLHNAHQTDKQDELKIEEITDQEKMNLRRRRYATDKSDYIPDKIAYKFASAPLGCYRLVFNYQGNHLAAACTYKNSKTVIKIFDVEMGIPFVTLKGHRNIIHDLKFSRNSKYLCSSSSDYTCKIWNVPQQTGEVINEDESDVLQICTLQHPSYVYSGIFLNDTRFPIIATACFDSRIRIWQADVAQILDIIDEPIQQEVISLNGIQFDPFDNLINHRHPNCIVYDGSKCMYVGDSLGSIHFYDINLSGGQYIARRLALITNNEYEGDPINSICIMPPENQDLLVHSRDNCIRVLDFKTSENKYAEQEQIIGTVTTRLFGTVSQKINIRSIPSPKGEYIISGSEDGKPHLWSNLADKQSTETFQYSLLGPIADVAWNESYHMIALAGFGDEHPIVVYVWERQGEMNFIEAKQLLDQRTINHQQDDEIQFNIQAKPTRQSRSQLTNQGLFQPQFQSEGGPFGNTQGPFGATINSQPFGGTQGPFGGAQDKSQGPFGNDTTDIRGPFNDNNNNNNPGPFGADPMQQFQVPPNQPNTPFYQQKQAYGDGDSGQKPF